MASSRLALLYLNATTHALRTKIATAPARPGVYLYKDKLGVVLYVGKALSLKDRLTSYLQKDIPSKTAQMLYLATTVSWIETGSEFEALLLEARLIKSYRPKFNVVFRDDKSYLYIFISLGEEFPKVFLARMPKNSTKTQLFNDLKGEYFGPFPSSRTTKQVLKWLRRAFPFCQQTKLNNRPCFYSHLGLCKPCPSFIIKQPPEAYKNLKKIYRTNVLRLKRILEGKFDSVTQGLEKEMRALSKVERFEEAQAIRNQLRRLTWVLHQSNSTAAFLENPNFYFETQKKAVDELVTVLKQHGVAITRADRIECFDVSTFQGTSSVAGQIVFIDGIPEKKWYRRYKIIHGGKPNDVAMLRETISRRLKHNEWPLPDLLVVDGGKPQVSTINQLLNELKITLPLIGLAKRLEQIVVANTHGFTIVTLPRKQKAIKLLQQIRDETHRFAIIYHRKRRQLTNFA